MRLDGRVINKYFVDNISELNCDYYYTSGCRIRQIYKAIMLLNKNKN